MTHRALIRAAVCAAASWVVVASHQLAGAANASAAWSVVPTRSPAGAQEAFLTDISCAARAACVAVGHFTDPVGAGEPLAERWNGRRWAIQSTPTPAGASTGLLFGVSCGTARSCVAVGNMILRSGIKVPLVERWDGRRWSVQPTPIEPVARRGRVSYLAGVSCPSTTACMAVGHSGNGAGTTGTTLAERWDGRRWSVEPTTAPAGAKVSFLSGVSCTSPTACTAVGHAVERSGLAVTLAERWDGSRWALQRTPTPLTTADVQLTGVACAAPTSCTAVGFFMVTGFDVMLAERWDGSRWSIEHTRYPAGARAVQLTAVACPSPSSCTAVGSFERGIGVEASLAERRSGTRWAIERPPKPAGATSTTLAGVSCWSATGCLAVGSFTNRSGVPQPLAERSS